MTTSFRQYLVDGLGSFERDPPDTAYQRGFQAAFQMVLEEYDRRHRPTLTIVSRKEEGQ